MIGVRGDALARAGSEARDPDPGHRLRDGRLARGDALVVEVAGDSHSPEVLLAASWFRRLLGMRKALRVAAGYPEPRNAIAVARLVSAN